MHRATHVQRDEAKWNRAKRACADDLIMQYKEGDKGEKRIKQTENKI